MNGRVFRQLRRRRARTRLSVAEQQLQLLAERPVVVLGIDLSGKPDMTAEVEILFDSEQAHPRPLPQAGGEK